jgi:hypothetical protein
MAQSNYGGIQPTASAYVKNFHIGQNPNSWNYVTNNNTLILTPTNPNATVYIKGNLFVGGTITNPSDMYLKDNIENLSINLTDNLLLLNPVTYTYKDDSCKKEHYGFIAQEVEQHLPTLVNTISTTIEDKDVEIKTVNYLEMIPLLLLKIKELQSQIDTLNKKISDTDK